MSEEQHHPRLAPSTAHRVLEKWVVALGLMIIVVVPPILVEAFPLTCTPMFARPMTERRFYSLHDALDHKLNNDAYGLRARVNWYLEGFYGVQFPKSVVVPPDQPANMHLVIDHVRRVGRDRNAAFPLRLRCRVMGPVDHQTIGVLAIEEWIIDHPDDSLSVASGSHSSGRSSDLPEVIEH